MDVKGPKLKQYVATVLALLFNYCTYFHVFFLLLFVSRGRIRKNISLSLSPLSAIQASKDLSSGFILHKMWEQKWSWKKSCQKKTWGICRFFLVGRHGESWVLVSKIYSWNMFTLRQTRRWWRFGSILFLCGSRWCIFFIFFFHKLGWNQLGLCLLMSIHKLSLPLRVQKLRGTFLNS